VFIEVFVQVCDEQGRGTVIAKCVHRIVADSTNCF